MTNIFLCLIVFFHNTPLAPYQETSILVMSYLPIVGGAPHMSVCPTITPSEDWCKVMIKRFKRADQVGNMAQITTFLFSTSCSVAGVSSINGAVVHGCIQSNIFSSSIYVNRKHKSRLMFRMTHSIVHL